MLLHVCKYFDLFVLLILLTPKLFFLFKIKSLMYITFEIFLANFSFISLFISMLFYWAQATNIETLEDKKNVFIFKILVNSKFIGSVGMLISNLSLFLLLVLRWNESGHFPLSNLYESLMFLSWSLTSIHLFIEFIYNSSYSFSLAYPKSVPDLNQTPGHPKADTWANKTEVVSEREPRGKDIPFGFLGLQFSGIKNKRKKLINKLIGSITAPSALFTNAFATFSLPKEMQESAPLVPALQSNWLMMHVTVMILSYAALILGSLLSIGFLVISSKFETNSLFSSNENKSLLMTPLGECPPESENTELVPAMQILAINIIPKEEFGSGGGASPGTRFLEEKNNDSGNLSFRINLAKTLDNLSYRILGLGFPLLTIGILSGAVWANEAWGSYWSWDPKETWALLTWLVFAIYLHTRLTKGWEGQKPALIASLGFVTVWICFLGVNLIGEGLHSYGWVS